MSGAPINDGGPAFPQSLCLAGEGSGDVSSEEVNGGGMTLRDYFAIHGDEPTMEEIASFCGFTLNGTLLLVI